jgi:phage terminase small subunit
MTIKQEKFALKYLETGNATQSYKEAGYSATTDVIAASEGFKLLRNQKVAALIEEKRAEFAAAAGVSIQWVFDRFKDISDRCMTVVPVMKWDPATKEMVQEKILNEFNEEVGLFTFDSAGANKATEAIGKHLGFFEKDNTQKKPLIAIKVGYDDNDSPGQSEADH